MVSREVVHLHYMDSAFQREIVGFAPTVGHTVYAGSGLYDSGMIVRNPFQEEKVKPRISCIEGNGDTPPEHADKLCEEEGEPNPDRSVRRLEGDVGDRLKDARNQ